jgi:hypothetical protein
MCLIRKKERKKETDLTELMVVACGGGGGGGGGGDSGPRNIPSISCIRQQPPTNRPQVPLLFCFD